MDPITWIKEWFKKNIGITDKEIEENVKNNYFEKGWLDSFSFITLISDLEKKFNIQFTNEDYRKEEFFTLEGLGNIIRRKINHA